MTNIFKDAKFGDRYIFDGDECLFLCEKGGYDDDGSEPLYELVRHRHIKYKDGSEKDFTENILARSDGFSYGVENIKGDIELLYVKRI